MPDAESSPLIYYPAYCWTASPTYNEWVKLSAADVHALTKRPSYEGQRVYFLKNHPIRYVRLVGLVTAFDDATETTLLEGPRRIARTISTPWTFTLDDGSGENVNVVCWKDDEKAELATRPGEVIRLRFSDLHQKPARTSTGKQISLHNVEVGSIVKVKGFVDEYRGRKQILLERVEVLKDTQNEVRAWAELAEFQSKVLARAWLLSQANVLLLKSKDERRRHRAAKAERKKRTLVGSEKNLEGGSSEQVHKSRVVPTKAKLH